MNMSYGSTYCLKSVKELGNTGEPSPDPKKTQDRSDYILKQKSRLNGTFSRDKTRRHEDRGLTFSKISQNSLQKENENNVVVQVDYNFGLKKNSRLKKNGLSLEYLDF